MFNCDKCHKTSKVYVKPNSVVVETREREYREWDHESRQMVVVGRGHETVKILEVCDSCETTMEVA